MTRLTSTDTSTRMAKKHEIVSLIMNFARKLDQDELRTLGDRFHQLARDTSQSQKEPPTFEAGAGPGPVWL